MKLTDEQIERAKTVNLPQFLLANGFDLKKSGREYVWKEHDSLHIRDNAPGERGQWYRFSESKGGDNIGFLREYMGMSFVEAVEALNGEHYERTYTSSRTYEPKPVQKTARELSLAEADNAKRVFAYLCKTRGLDYDMVSALVRGGSISQEEKTGNVLFKYYDDQGKVIGAEKVGTSTEHKFKGIATGSAGGHGFEVVRGSGEKAFFFESAIDMLSYLQMHDKELDNCRLVSIMGVKPNIVLDTMARHNISPENVSLCSDNDTAGNDFADRLREQYPEMKRIATPDTYKDWNDMLRGIPKVAEQEKDKKEADRKNMQYYGNEMWNKATDNRDKSLVTVRLSEFQRVQETLEKSGINYYAYEMNGAVRMAVNDKDIDWLRNILGNVNITKSNKPYSPPEKNIFGTAEYRYIPQKEYLTADRDLVLKMAEIMARRGMQFSGRVYPSGKGTLTVSHADLYAVRSIRDEVTNMRKQFASPEKGEPVGNRDYRANRYTHYYMSKLTPEQFKEVKPFLETSVGYHAVSRDGKVAFAVDKENASAFHRAFENAVREVGMLKNMADLGLPMEQNVALSPVVHRLAVEDMKLNLADFFDKRYDEAQFGEMLSLVNAYISQAPAERYGENSKLNDMLEAKSSFDRAIELSDFFFQHDFSDEQRAAITAMFVGDMTRGQIESIDETFTAEDIQAYDEILHNALQESDVADFLTAHKQAVIDREKAARVPTEEEALFPKADLAKFLAERSLSSDEWEDMAYPLFENGYLDKHKPSDKGAFGYHLSETALYDLARRYHDGEDIRRELALGLMEHTTSEDIEFVFEDGKISDRTFYYAENLRHSLHLEKTDDGYNCTFGGMERFVSFEDIGQAFIDRTHEEFEDLMYWRVLDYIKDDIPDITDETVQQLITAFDGAALHGWENGDNQPKLNRIKKALFDVLGDEEQTEKAFAVIAKQKYNVSFEPEKPESSIHFGLLGNGITAYDVSRTDKETNDYPTVAHISPEGVVRIYDSSISAKDMERINEQARLAREKFMTDWNMLSPEQQFQRLYDRADISTTVNIGKEKLSMEEKIEKYMPFVFFGEGERPEPEAEKHIKSAVESIEFIGDRNSFETVKKAAQSQSFGTTVADGDTLTVVINDNADVKDVRRLIETAQDNGIYLNVPSAKMFESRFGADFMQESHKPVVDTPEVKKVHQVITNAGFDGGIDDKMEYATVDEAIKTGRDYIADGYLGFSVYNQETKKIEHIEGDFPLDEAFNPNILRINGMHEMANEVQARMDEIEKNVPEPDTKDLGSVTMRKVGDFYEMYGTNAEIGTEVLGLRMLSKNGQPMVGFPDHVKDEYSKKLRDAGYSVLIEQAFELNPPKRETEKLQTLQQVVDKFFGTDCESAETERGTWKLAIADGDKVGELFYDGDPVCGIYNRSDKMEIEPYRELTTFPALLRTAMLEHNPDKPVEIMEFQRSFETPLDKAKLLINDFCEAEYRDGADFFDLHNIGLAYTTLTDDELPIQVTADLVDYKITYEFDGEVYNTEQYDSIEDMIENVLTGLDFNDLVSVPDDIIEKHTHKDEQTIELMSDASEVKDISSPDDVPPVALEYKGNAESIAEIKDKALSLGAVVTVDNAEGTISISTYENHKDELDGIAYELGLMSVVDETSDVDKPLFTDDSVIEEIQRNERSDNPFWETPDIQGEQLSLFGDPEPVHQEKPKSEFAKGPVVDGVQVYEALAAEIDRGTGFVGGKLRVQDFYEQQHPTLQQLADFLKKEYGTGGHSGEGKISLVDYNSQGITFNFENGEKFRHSWYNVATMTEARLRDDTYLSAEQKEERVALKAEKAEEYTAFDTVEVGDQFRNKATGVVSEVVSLTGALPYYKDDCTVKRLSGAFEITENISYDNLLNSGLYEYIGRNEPEKEQSAEEIDKKVVFEMLGGGKLEFKDDKMETLAEIELSTGKITYFTDNLSEKDKAYIAEKSKQFRTEEKKPDIPTVKNLSQLKKAIKPGMMFEITDHLRPECIGERRVVTGVTTVDFTSRKIDENGEPTGKDLHMDFDRAKKLDV